MHLLHKVNCMLNRVDPIPLTPRKGTKRRLIETNNLKVIKATRVLHPMRLRILNLILQPSNRVVKLSKKRVFV